MSSVHWNVSSIRTQSARRRGLKDSHAVALLASVGSLTTYVGFGTIASQPSFDSLLRHLHVTTLASNTSVNEAFICARHIHHG